MDELNSPSSSLPPRTVDSSDQDLALATSHLLTREEVLRRRLHRVKQLARCYRGHYWALMEEVKSKYRDYYWTYGKGPFKDHQKNNGPNHIEGSMSMVSGESVNSNNGNEKVARGSAAGVGDGIVRCASSCCKSKAMALTRYCRNHILADSKQKLYRGCNSVAKELATGPLICNKPVLRSMFPPVCPTHHRIGKRCLIRAVRRAGYTIPNNREPNPKLHLVVAEFVRQIQVKRKVAVKATLPKAGAE